MSKTALVTGVAGFMGSHIADALLKQGWKVVGIDNLIGGYADNVPSGVDFFCKDLSSFDEIHEHFRNVDIVIHCACTAYEGLSVFSPSLVVQNTVQITATSLSAAVRHGVRKFIFLSSMARYGSQEKIPFTEDLLPKPQDPYGIAKVCAENLVENIAQTHQMEFAILIPHNIIGPRQKYDDPYRNVASIMINRMLQGKQPIIYGNGEQRRCFSFMSDVVQPIMFVVENEIANGQIINIGPDEEFITINELATKLSKILNFELDPIYMPGRPQEVMFANCSAQKARTLLGYKTQITLDVGLQELADWIRSRGSRPFSYHLPLEFVTDSTPKTWSEKLM